jgi:LysR family hydrogen peroxide-inducible transcriptional activator
LPKAAPALRKRYPALTVAWVEDKTEGLVARLAQGQLEGAIVALEAEIGDVEHEVIATDPFVVVIPSGHALAASGSPVAASALRREQVLLLDEGHCFRHQALEVCSAARAEESDFRATSLPTLVQMVAGGVGITLLPEIAVATEISRATLRVRPLAAAAAHRTIAMIWRKGSPLAPALRALTKTVRDAYPA